MAYIETSGGPRRERRPLGQTIKRAAIGLLFTAILLIPRIRRLRRKTRAWTVVRVCAAVLGAWLIERIAVAQGGAGFLMVGILLVIFAAVFRARPERKSVDAIAREFHALVVLNGGGFLDSPEGKPIPNVHLVVNPERLIVLNEHERSLAQIPFSEMREIVMEPAEIDAKKKNPARRLRIRWESPEIHLAHFCYDGFFAEHLAGIAERTLRSIWKKELPVLRS